MATHFLAGELEGLPRFVPEVWYNAIGDCVEFCAEDVAVVADRIDDVITIYRSAVDERPIGFQIKGVLALLRLLDASMMRVEHQQAGSTVTRVSVDVLLAAAVRKSMEGSDVPRRLDRYPDFFRTIPPVTHPTPREIEVPIGA